MDIVGTEDRDSLIGTDDSDNITGLGGRDVLNGGLGADTMAGGPDTDVYYVDNVGDVVIEAAGEGDNDTVFALISYKLPANVEYLSLYDGGNYSATGNELDNWLSGNLSDNILDGGLGADTMSGGEGSDTYIIDNPGDVVAEVSSSGFDTVMVSFSYTLPQYFENLTLTGTTGRQGSGNDVGNVLTGTTGDDVLRGNGGMDVLNGGSGADAMYGGWENDIFWVDDVGDKAYDYAGQGTDTVMSSVTYSLTGTSIENLTLVGSADINASGNGLDNVLTGNDGANVFHGGGGGNDTFAGQGGDDLYWVDGAGDRVVETAGGGNDTIMSSGDYDLTGRFVETLTLTGSADLSATGNSQANQLFGNSGSNHLDGGFGDDVLDGRAGADRMAGGKGDDTYYVDSAGDVIYEDDNQGKDTVYSSVSYSLHRGLETLVLTGSANIDGFGDGYGNTLIGNSGDNHLAGGRGRDYYTGGLGADTFVFGAAPGPDYISDFSVAEGDMIDLSAVTHGQVPGDLQTRYITENGISYFELSFNNLYVDTIRLANLIDSSEFRSHIIW